MITGLISEISQQLVTENAAWLSEVRAIGYMTKSEDRLVITDGENEIGITDREGNSGYIRFMEGGDNFSVTEIPAYTSCKNVFRYTYRLRLVIVAKTNTPENLSLLLASQLNGMTFSDKSAKVRVSGGGTNSVQVSLAEGSEQINPNFRVLYLNFTLQLDLRGDCEIPVQMACEPCDNFYDLGCVKHCKTITVHAHVEYTGTATLNTFFNGIMVTQSFEVTETEDLEIPMTGLNENYEYIIQIRDEDGEIIPLFFDHGHDENGHGHGGGQGHDGHEYECFKIQLVP